MKKKTNVTLVTMGIFIATFMTAVEGTIVTTAMPTIIGNLQGIAIMNWVFSIYLLTNAMMTPIYGKLADNVGRKPIFMLGIFIFMIGSSLCGLAQTMYMLIIARGIQGIGAGAIMPVALTIIADLFEVEKRAKMLGLTNAAWGIASVVGPLLGGLIVDTIGWHWIFFINVPIGLVLLVIIGFFFVEEPREKVVKKLDYRGSGTLLIFLLTLLLSFQFMGEEGFSQKAIWLLIISLIALRLFVVSERKAEDPLIDLSLFTSRFFVIINLVTALVGGFLMGIEVYIPMWMQGVLGLSAGIGGLVLAPLSIVWMMGSFLAGRWLVRLSEKQILLRGVGIIFIGSLILASLPQSSNVWVFPTVGALLGLGLGITITTSTVSVQNSVTANQVGVATSFNTLVRTVGQTIMVAIFGIVLNMSNQRLLAKGAFPIDKEMMNQLVNPQTARELPDELLFFLREILYQGLHQIYLLGAGLILLAFLLVVRLKREKVVD